MFKSGSQLSLWNALWVVLALWATRYFVKRWASVRHALRTARQYPGGEILWIHPFSAFSILLAPVFPRIGMIGTRKNYFSVYNKYGSTMLSSVVFWNSDPVLWFADADALKTVTSDRYTFPKPVASYVALNVYGPNIVSTEGSDWKRHRAVARSAFNEANNGLVWAESIRIVNEWFNHLDNSDPSKLTFDAVPAMTQITLLVISAAGFGRRWAFGADFEATPPGYRLSMSSALQTTLDGLLARLLIPKWFKKLSQRVHIPFFSAYLQKVDLAVHELKLHFLQLVSAAREWVVGNKTSTIDAALLRNLVEANMAQEGDSRGLTEGELLSDIFTFLLAGHETSSHSLSFALALLALHPDIQQKLYDEVVSVWPQGPPRSSEAAPFKDDFPKLQYTSAVFHETLRRFPPVVQLSRPAIADAILPAKRFTKDPRTNKVTSSEEYNVNVPKGMLLRLDILACHHNPLYWGEDAYEFKPERFIDTDTYRWPRDAFFAFSAGPRSCIGQRFSLTESVCILASIVRRYQILVPEDLQSLSQEEKKKVMLDWFSHVTTTPKHAWIRLRRRS